MRRLPLLPLLLLPFGAAPAAAQTALCRAAITAAEAEFAIPDRLLLGIGRLESGRRDPQTGVLDPWPWTINAEGRGSFFPSREAAIAAVRELQAQGVRSIDVGCMQINLRHHPGAFASLEEAFDPAANVRYGARFLTALRERAGDWTMASGHYHSQTPELAKGYRTRLARLLAAEQRAPTPEPAPVLPPAPGGVALAAFAGATGRGLDSYRLAPIPMAGRGPLPPAEPPRTVMPTARPMAAAPAAATAPAAVAAPRTTMPGPAPTAGPLAAAAPPAPRAPHVVAVAGPGGIGGRRLF